MPVAGNKMLKAKGQKPKAKKHLKGAFLYLSVTEDYIISIALAK
jgi:hypothetical protein